MKKIIILCTTLFLCANGFGQLSYSKVLLDSVFYGIAANSTVRTYDNGYVIVGDAGIGYGLLMKVDSMGNPQWNKIIHNTVVTNIPDVSFNRIISIYDSSLIACGFAYNNSSQSMDALCFKMNMAGDTSWTK